MNTATMPPPIDDRFAARAAWHLLTWKQRYALVTAWEYIPDGYNGDVCPVLRAEYRGKAWYIARFGFFPA